MKTFSEKIYRFSCRFLQVFSLLLIGLLFLGAFFSTCYSLDMESQQVLTKWDNPVTNLLGMSLFFIVLFSLSHWLAGKHIRLLTALVLGWCLAVGAILIVFSKTVPAADSLSVYSLAESLASGDTSVIHPSASYLSYYPQQIGLTAFFELFIRLCRLLPFRLPYYHLIKCFYVLLVCTIILLQEKTVHLLWADEKTDCLYLLLAGANLPLLMYSSFVYGEIPSFCAASLGLYLLARLWREQTLSRWGRLGLSVLSLICLALSVLLRKNNLILIIALLIVVFFQWLKQKNHRLAVWGILCGLCCALALPVTQKIYEFRAGNTLSSGVTAVSYLAMGMQESTRGNGWYNGFNFNAYQNSGLDSTAANAVSLDAIRERLDYFSQNPGYAADFYLHKHLSQWADGTYASRQATLATYGGRIPFFNSLYEGKGSHIYIAYCNIYQNILYLGVLLFCLKSFLGRQDSLPPYLGLIGVIGGFLFHIFWEANSRYIFLYGLLLMPYAAHGLSGLLRGWENRKKESGETSGICSTTHI